MKKIFTILFVVMIIVSQTSCDNSKNITEQSTENSEVLSENGENVLQTTHDDKTNNIMFYAKEENWSCINYSEDEWLYTSWTVYYNGTVEKYDMFNLSGEKNKITYTLSDKSFKKMIKLLNRKFKSIDKGSSAYDGTGWTMIYYSMDNTELHKFEGYIYDIIPLEEIQKILEEND